MAWAFFFVLQIDAETLSSLRIFWVFSQPLVADNTPRESHSSLLVLFYLGWDEFAAASRVFIGRLTERSLTSFVTSLWQQITGCPQAALYLTPRHLAHAGPDVRRVSAIKVGAATAPLNQPLSDAARACEQRTYVCAGECMGTVEPCH